MKTKLLMMVTLTAHLLLGLAPPALALQIGSVATQEDVDEILRRGGCLLCHRWTRPWIGPSFRDIAKSYQGLKGQERYALVTRLRAGSVGNHSPIPMTPCDVSRISDEDLRAIIDHVLDRGTRPDLGTR